MLVRLLCFNARADSQLWQQPSHSNMPKRSSSPKSLSKVHPVAGIINSQSM